MVRERPTEPGHGWERLSDRRRPSHDATVAEPVRRGAAASDRMAPWHDVRVSEEQHKAENRGRPTTDEFRAFVAADWAPRSTARPAQAEAAPYAAQCRAAVSAAFPGERLVIPAGGLKVRNNDCDYIFRPHSAFAHLTGLGSDREPDAVLVLEPLEDGSHSQSCTCDRWQAATPRSSSVTPATESSGSAPGQVWPTSRPSWPCPLATSMSSPTRWARTSAPPGSGSCAMPTAVS